MSFSPLVLISVALALTAVWFGTQPVGAGGLLAEREPLAGSGPVTALAWASSRSASRRPYRVDWRRRALRYKGQASGLGRTVRSQRVTIAKLRERLSVRYVQAHHETVTGWPWVAIADCESGDGDGQPPYTADWAYDGPSGFDGGLQHDPSTWSAYRHADEPAYAYEASPAVQVAVAERVLADQGWGAWPTCSRKVGLR